MSFITPESQEYQDVMTHISESAQKGYIDLAYHNWEHAAGAMETGRILVDLSEEHGKHLDQFVIDASCLLHDYDFHKPNSNKNIRSKELRSSRAAGLILREIGIDREQINHVQACIRSTEKGVACYSDEARVVRRADLANISGDYLTFISSSWHLYKESKQLNRQRIPLRNWLNTSLDILKTYISEDVRLNFEVDNGIHCKFQHQAIINIGQLSCETAKSFIKKVTN